MPFVQFSGTNYTAPNYNFIEPGVYEKDDAKAKQVIADFPDQFALVEDKTELSKSATADMVEQADPPAETVKSEASKTKSKR